MVACGQPRSKSVSFRCIQMHSNALFRYIHFPMNRVSIKSGGKCKPFMPLIKTFCIFNCFATELKDLIIFKICLGCLGRVDKSIRLKFWWLKHWDVGSNPGRDTCVLEQET